MSAAFRSVPSANYGCRFRRATRVSKATREADYASISELKFGTITIVQWNESRPSRGQADLVESMAALIAIVATCLSFTR
jgi:hypothetical protein